MGAQQPSQLMPTAPKKSLDLGSAHVSRMPLLVEQDKSPDPLHVRLLGPVRVMFHSQDITDLIMEFARRVYRTNLHRQGRRNKLQTSYTSVRHIG